MFGLLVLAGVINAAFVPRYPVVICSGPPEAAIASNLATMRDVVDGYAQAEGHHPRSRSEWRGLANRYIRVHGSDDEPALTNPLAGDDDVRFVDEMPPGPIGNQAWIYALATGEFRCNSRGVGIHGTAYFDL